MFSQDFKEFVELLIKHKAEYLLTDLLKNKKHTGRPRDIDDIDNLT